jgi:hypothetical protein
MKGKVFKKKIPKNKKKFMDKKPQKIKNKKFMD